MKIEAHNIKDTKIAEVRRLINFVSTLSEALGVLSE
jgi:hypothetical protein